MFFPPTEVLKKLVCIRIRLILVVTKTLKKIQLPEVEILAHKVEKYKNVTVDLIPLYACAKLFTRARNDRPSIPKYSL